MVYVTAAIINISALAPAAGWNLAGDINIQPGALGPLPMGVFQQNTGGATHLNGSNLDYMFYSVAGPYANCLSAGNFVASDHLQVRFA